MPEPVRHAILERAAPRSALGHITLMASIDSSRGVMPRSPLRTYGSYAAVYITRGRGVYRDESGLEQPVSAGDMIFVFPEVAHTYGPAEGEAWDEIYVVFNGPAFDSWRAMGVLDAKRPVRTARPVDAWRQRFQELAAMLNATPDQSAAQVCALLSMITEIRGGDSSAAALSPASEWSVRACAALASDLDIDLGIAELAARLDMTAETFRKRFRETTGLSPIHYRSRKRIEVACELLQFTSLTQAHIAKRLAFADEYHFSKRFKEMQGSSPREFRRKVMRYGEPPDG
jgi:AraC-like DNA-binding protein